MERRSEYTYRSPEPTHDDAFLWDAVRRALFRHVPPPASVCEIGCGNGVNARRMSALGYSVTAVDASESAIAAARSVPGSVRFEVASVYDPLDERFGTFDSVVSLEVLEHLYAPHELPEVAYSLLRPGGYALFSTPYHGWLKNVVIAVLGRFDKHFNPLWDHGHIKFFSRATLSTVLAEAKLHELSLQRLGRVPVLARTMLVVAQRTAG
jgi:2-polyprenyl-3-methyl-5-hydroxy-6-metoxy-1,4-benzoquinol methylase